MSEILLGKKVNYDSKYNPNLLFPIPREKNRNSLASASWQEGFDIWNCYEVSWLNSKGKPQVKILELYVKASSPYIFESKSLKLYLYSLNNEKFESQEEILKIIKTDLENLIKSEITLIFRDLDFFNGKEFTAPNAHLIDNFEADGISASPSYDIIKIEQKIKVEEKLYSNLLRSNCLITNQPDWATILISYKGAKIAHDSLLAYILSYRNHNEFHEHCAERIYSDIMHACSPKELTIYARYTRRGGIDINPIRSSLPIQNLESLNFRLARQ